MFNWNSCYIYNLDFLVIRILRIEITLHSTYSHTEMTEREHCTVWFWFPPPFAPSPLSVWYFLPTIIWCSGSPAYQQAWLRGDPEGPAAHVHEGVQLADKSGWVAIGEVLPEDEAGLEVYSPKVTE